MQNQKKRPQTIVSHGGSTPSRPQSIFQPSKTSAVLNSVCICLNLEQLDKYIDFLSSYPTWSWHN